MELTPPKYYNQDRFANSYYLMLMAVEEYFGRELFKGDASRVYYASPEYTLRRRLDILNQNGNPVFHSLDFPFMSYFRHGNWEIDRGRMGVESSAAALFGMSEEEYGYQNLRFMNSKMTLTCRAMFTRDDEAQLAYETLLWVKHPNIKQFSFSGLAYKGYPVDIPIQFQIDNLVFDPTFRETDWLKKNRVFVIQFDLTVRSVVIAQIAQGSTSEIFETTDDPSSAFYITKEALLDYYSSKNLPLPDEQHIEIDESGIFNSDPTLNAVFNVASKTDTTAVVSWDYTAGIESHYDANVTLSTNTGFSIAVPIATKTYTFVNLQPESTYELTIGFHSTDYNYINKYYTTVTTNKAGDNSSIQLKVL